MLQATNVLLCLNYRKTSRVDDAAVRATPLTCDDAPKEASASAKPKAATASVVLSSPRVNEETRHSQLWTWNLIDCWTPCLQVSQQFSAQYRSFNRCVSNSLNCMGCAKGSSAAHEHVAWNVQFVFRGQTFNHFYRTEEMFGISKFAL